MSIKITEDDRLMAEFTNDEVTRIEVTFEHGRQTWILEGDHWEVVPGWDIVDGKLVPATNCKACEDGGSHHADGCEGAHSPLHPPTTRPSSGAHARKGHTK